MSVAVSHLQAPIDRKYPLPSIKQSYQDYKATFAQLLHKKAEASIAYKHPGDAAASFCPVNYDQLEAGKFLSKVTLNQDCPVDERQIGAIEPIIVSPRLSFEPAKLYYAHPTLAAPKVTSLQYEFLTESQWRAINPYWTKLLKGLTEKLKQESLDNKQQKKHFLAYALESMFRGIDFGQSEETIEICLKDNASFVCLQDISDFVKGDILIASSHSAIYFGGDKVMASLGQDKRRPRYMDLADFTNHPHLASYKVYRFTA